MGYVALILEMSGRLAIIMSIPFGKLVKILFGCYKVCVCWE